MLFRSGLSGFLEPGLFGQSAGDAEADHNFRMFPYQSFPSRSLPDCNCGLTVDSIEEFLPFVLRLVCVMQSWKGGKPSIFNLTTQSYQEINGSEATALEEAATKYYCQQFFNYFGGAALVPHRLFMPTISLAGFM